jgi:hypothetical protein
MALLANNEGFAFQRPDGGQVPTIDKAKGREISAF